ncbi:hypothetical protein ACFZC6_02110 [Streptomyces ossamyceticus]|uniref:hypothetical protein n=1 Tax=Streptomyces ossamyceticus TaxID=249581 RepID=UPI0036E504B9
MSTSTITVRFEAPAPEPFRRLETRQAFAEALRSKPGEWALLGKYSTPGTMRQEAYAVRQALDPKDQPFAPAGSFEAEARSVCGEFRVYVRYVGGGAA